MIYFKYHCMHLISTS